MRFLTDGTSPPKTTVEVNSKSDAGQITGQQTTMNMQNMEERHNQLH